MSCEHENSKPTRRVTSDGRVVVFLQCQLCGSGRHGKKSDHNIDALPPFDEQIPLLYMQRQKEEWERRNARFEIERLTKTGEWWEKYKSYLASWEWSRVSRIVVERDHLCQRCLENVAQQAHHLTYETYNKHGFTFPAECVGVCAACHEELHSHEPQ